VKYFKYFLLSIGVIAIDQISKLLVYFNMTKDTIGEINVIGTWFRLHYLTNKGMAFGLEIDAEYGKMILTIFRLVAIIGIGYYMYRMVKSKAHPGLVWCLALIFGGAMGNAIDSTFYGVWLNNAPPEAPTPWFHGQVIDMLYFPIFDGYYPDWFPYLGGKYFQFFRPVFNLADTSIFIGVVLILLFQKRYLNYKKPADDEAVEQPEASEADTEQPSEVAEQYTFGHTDNGVAKTTATDRPSGDDDATDTASPNKAQ